MMNSYQTNPYLNISSLDQGFLEAQKAQERLAIKSILKAKKSKIKSQNRTLTAKLSSKKTEMSNFAGKKVVSNFKEGLSGKSAQAAEKHLASKRFAPNLRSPIK